MRSGPQGRSPGDGELQGARVLGVVVEGEVGEAGIGAGLGRHRLAAAVVPSPFQGSRGL